MFIDGVHHSDEEFRRDAEELSKSFLAIMKHYQNRRPTPELVHDVQPQGPARIQDGTVTVHCILAGNAFATAVLIKDLDRRQRRKLREYMIGKFDEVLRELGA